jgi:hypothetical protein
MQLESDSRLLGNPEDSLRSENALVYKPAFDEETGLHYVDIGVDVDPAHMPFVQLSVARFQPHAAHGLFLSPPLVLDQIQIPASRTVTVTTDSTGSQIAVAVSGSGYWNRSPMNGPVPATEAKYLAPQMRIRLLRQMEDGRGHLQSYNETGEPLAASECISPQAASDRAAAQCWSWGPIPLPLPLGSQHYAVQVDEVELHVADGDDGGASMAPDKTIEKPAMFSCLIEVNDQ